MAKKRKSVNAGLDEVERTLYTSFCTAANSISQLYTQAQHQQKLSFQAGERYGLEKLYQWLLRVHQAGSNISTAEILNYLQNELDGGDEMPMSIGHQLQHQLPPQNPQQPPLSSHQAQTAGAGYTNRSQAQRMGSHVDQSKISVFTEALSSPNRRLLTPFGIVQGAYGSVNSNSSGGHTTRRSGSVMDQHQETGREDHQDSPTSHEETYNSSSVSGSHPGQAAYGYNTVGQQGRDHHSGFVENDANMDMHADGVSDDFYQ